MMQQHVILSVMTLAVIIPAIGLAVANDYPKVIADSRIVYQLDKLAEDGTRTITSDYGVTHAFVTVDSGDGWYDTTITTTSSTKSESVTFKFKYDINKDEYLLVAEDLGINTKVVMPKIALDSPDVVSKTVSDSNSNDPYNLFGQSTQWCALWTDTWTVESSQSNYIGKVHVEWDGEPWFNYYCLFPYDLDSVTISYEGESIYNIVSGDDNFDVGSPTYNLSGLWRYNSAS